MGSELKTRGTETDAYRHRLLREFLIQAGASTVAVAVLLHIVFDQGWYPLIVWTFLPLLYLAWTVYRRTRSLVWGANIVNVTLFTLCAIAMVLSGGLEGVSPVVLLTLPMLGLILVGPRLGALWLLIVAAWVLGLGLWDVLYPIDPLFLTVEDFQYINWALMLSMTTAALYLTYTYDKMRRTIEADMERATTRLLDLLRELKAAAAQLEDGARRLRGGVNDEDGILRRMQQAATDGRAALSDNHRGLNQVMEHVALVAQTVTTFHANAGAVGDLLASIQRISQRLDLMALNMSLEAAKAGDTGQPFAVLARDMRRIAERVQDDLTLIQTKIAEVDARSREALAVTASSEAIQERGEQNATAIADMFERVCALVEEASVVGLGFSEAALGHMDALEHGIRDAFGER